MIAVQPCDSAGRLYFQYNRFSAEPVNSTDLFHLVMAKQAARVTLRRPHNSISAAFTQGRNNMTLLYIFGTTPYREFTIETIEYMRAGVQIGAAVSGGATG
jgi:hypothetical protein